MGRQIEDDEYVVLEDQSGHCLLLYKLVLNEY